MPAEVKPDYWRSACFPSHQFFLLTKSSIITPAKKPWAPVSASLPFLFLNLFLLLPDSLWLLLPLTQSAHQGKSTKEKEVNASVGRDWKQEEGTGRLLCLYSSDSKQAHQPLSSLSQQQAKPSYFLYAVGNFTNSQEKTFVCFSDVIAPVKQNIIDAVDIATKGIFFPSSLVFIRSCCQKFVEQIS